jgi:hypothetical protein
VGGIVIETDDARIEIPKGSIVAVNGAGDKVVSGYRSPEDKKEKRIAMMALVPQEHVRYLYFQGDVKIVKRKEPKGAGRSD